MPQSRPDSISRVLLREAALKRGLQVTYVGTNDYALKITDATGHSELLAGSLSTRSSAIGNIIAHRKHLTIDFVQSLGFTTPATSLYDNLEQASNFMQQYGRIVVKPSDAGQSKGVTTNVHDQASLEQAIAYARHHSLRDTVLLQQHIDGKLYRLFVLDGTMVAAAHRKAPEVIGDGVHSVAALVAQLNTDPRRGTDDTTPLKRIDTLAAEQYVGADQYQAIPASGEIIKVSAIDSISAGGEAENTTESVHPDYARIAERISKELNLFVCGYDILCTDIAMQPAANYFPILEMNSMPGLKLHTYPTAGGEPIDLAGMMIDRLFP